MSTKKIIIVIIVLLAVVVGYWLISPLFIEKEVDESLDELLEQAGVTDTMQPPSEAPGMEGGPDSAPSAVGPTEPPPPSEKMTDDMEVSEEKMMAMEKMLEETGGSPETMSESMPEPEEPRVSTAGQGTFNGLAGHSGEGTAKLLQIDGKYFVRFESDFSVTNGPDLYVGFGNSGVYERGTEVGRLKGNKGSQNYEVPAGIDPTQYNEIWVWCRAFSVPFASATIK